ncbi:LPS export ABC transporter permease LptF [Tepidimonas charontis]|uniref:Lipopolysaccharide export system permease protein LptF n=1 Tax=Tepidimonas charontis TaxID=2267262 RepID=A0A554XL02_9BURK|nr:LPS export ABC transporter permease LptF [Tepidimonas charontis]TSE36504.1 Lipopolysaccharide export system permease protein LptF [Tepidimonas charontis]
MLFETSLRRELGRSFGAALVVMLTVVITITLVRTLGQASRGEVDPQALALFMTYGILGSLDLVLTMALFAAVVGTLSRWYRDSEMVIWHSSGVALTRLLAPVARFAWPMWLAIAALTTVVGPWAQGQRDALRTRYEQRGDLQRVTPGQFQESRDGRRVLFIDRQAVNANDGRNVFVASHEPDGGESVVSAQRARLHTQDGVLYLVLESGERLWRGMRDGVIEWQWSRFEQHWVRLRDAEPTADEALRLGARSTWSLWHDPAPASLAELSWRIGMVLAAVNLVGLAVAVSSARPRAGRSGAQLFMLLAFITYHNMLGASRAWIANGRIDASVLLLALHGSVALLTALWLLHREHPWPDRLRRWRATPARESA